MDRLQEYYKQSLLANLCTQYKGLWRSAMNDKEKLFRLAVSQQAFPHMATFANDGNGLTKDYILKEFGDYVNGKYIAIDVDGVKDNYKTELYVGYNDVLKPYDDVLQFMWSTIPQLEIPLCKATKIYVSCGSEIHLECEGYNNITVMLFDNSVLWLDDVDSDSSVTIYRYSDKASVDIGKYCLSHKVRIFDKQLKL